MRLKIPSPSSGGLILSYKCSAECRHCIYGCSKKWSADWISEADLEKILTQLSVRIYPSPYGKGSTTLSHGLHFTGGEPFINFNLLCKAVETASDLGIPSLFVETNCFWAINDRITEEKLKLLRSKGLHGIMISVNPFYLEYVPFERTHRTVRIALNIFGRNTMVYQLEYYKRFMQWGLKGRVSLQDYLKLEKGKTKTFLHNVEFFIMGRAPYVLKDVLRQYYSFFPASSYFYEPCITPFLRSWHNHFDNYCNYIPGFCGGITLGDCRNLDRLLNEGIELDDYPVLKFLVENNLKGLFEYATKYGYKESKDGYLSKCHVCTDLRKFLVKKNKFRELQPEEFYEHLC
jgi:hypothetical protein